MSRTLAVTRSAAWCRMLVYSLTIFVCKSSSTRLIKGVKLPPIAVNHEANIPTGAALTIAKLEKGDSFLVSNELAALKATQVLRGFQKRERARKGGREFTSRKAGAGVRIWRIR